MEKGSTVDFGPADNNVFTQTDAIREKKGSRLPAWNFNEADVHIVNFTTLMNATKNHATIENTIR